MTSKQDLDALSWVQGNLELAFGILSLDAVHTSDIEKMFAQAVLEQQSIERGDKVNTDEDRQVGHYWLRTPDLAPAGIGNEITAAQTDVIAAVKSILSECDAQGGRKWTDAVVVGIGGSSLGAAFVSQALGLERNRKALSLHFLDNTDPDGATGMLDAIGDRLVRTLVIMISKSGSTRETQNGYAMLAARFERAGLNVEHHSIGVSMPGSKLHQMSEQRGFLYHFPIWDFVGGRTSITSSAGILPLALAGADIESFLRGAAKMDQLTRNESLRENPAGLLAVALYQTCLKDEIRQLAIVPYRDRLAKLAMYLQQLFMESLGKELDRDGKVVNQGLTVFGNKGSTDQHSYFQQLRDGRSDVVTLFVESVLEPSGDDDIEIEDGVLVSDYLFAFLHGSRAALSEKRRHNFLISLQRVDEESIGGLLALFERAVGFLGTFLNINAYSQPGVEAGKKAAEAIIALQRDLQTGTSQTDQARREQGLKARLMARLRKNGRL
ncbi:MAG: glucose-6-phosphate isomerase [Pseudomonadota bacterium]